MRMYDIIEKKRLGKSLTRDEIYFAVNGFVAEDIPDYQMSAFLMAALLRGLDEEETHLLTQAMLESGDRADLSEFGDLTADKHSTGGVGDKTTLITLPIAASCGVICAKMSGRGLGHTGGTIDKLESLSGYKAALSTDEFFSQVKEIGISVIAQSGNFVPADKKLYALRDVTATVDSLPLIASSIMSKKLASGSASIVLDVKCGSGAFMKNFDEAMELGRAMVDIGNRAGRRTKAYITNMDRVLGNAVGNSLEVAEAVDVLRGEGPRDVREMCLALASSMISMALSVDEEKAMEDARDSLDSGKAYETFSRWIHTQGGAFSDDCPEKSYAVSKYTREIVADREGYIHSCDCASIGKSACVLGAGRLAKDDPIDFGAGIRVLKKPGDRISAGDTVAILYTNSPDTLDPAEKIFRDAHTVSPEVPEKTEPLILGKV